MLDYALILNAGSSSLKFCVFERMNEVEKWHLACRGQISGIGTAPRFSASDADGHPLARQKFDGVVHDQSGALDQLASWLRFMYGGNRVLGVGHRVVHGGAKFHGPTIITPEVREELGRLVPLAPLHQPYNLAAIDAVTARLPEVPQVACFDTSFHRTQSPLADLIPLPHEIRDAGVQRYGFHGLSYEYIASALPTAAPEIAQGRVIVAHLGSGASMCAIHNGKSVDNTLGFTALDGLCMGSRPGAVDPGVILHLIDGMGFSAKEVSAMLYKKSGLLGISEVSNDMRDLLASPEPAAKLAVDYFVYRCAKEIGSLAAVLAGIDGIVFTGGIGENSPEIRRRIGEASAWLGLSIDTEANGHAGPRISTRTSKISAWVIPTNEELMIARHTGLLLGLVAAHA